MRLNKGLFHKKEIYFLVVALIAVVAVTAGLPFLLAGQTVTTGANPEVHEADAISCAMNGREYPVLGGIYDRSKYALKIKGVFRNDVVEMLGLYYTVNYGDASGVADALRGEMKAKFQNDGVEVDGGLSFDVVDDGAAAEMRLVAKGNDAVALAAKYFLIDASTAGKSKADYVRQYTAQGFICEN